MNESDACSKHKESNEPGESDEAYESSEFRESMNPMNPMKSNTESHESNELALRPIVLLCFWSLGCQKHWFSKRLSNRGRKATKKHWFFFAFSLLSDQGC